MVATNVNDMPAFSNADEFLKYCRLVKDGLINQEGNDIKLLTNEARVFCESVIKKANFCQEKNGTCSSFLLLEDGKGPEFVSRLFQSSCYSPWLYRHLRTLHSNMVVEKKTPGISKSEIRFVIPYLESLTWMTTPRLPISMGWESHKLSNYQNDGLLKLYKDFPTIDKCFGISYLYVLSAIDSHFANSGSESLLSKLLEKHTFLIKSYWRKPDNKPKNDLLAKVIGITPANNNSDQNVFGEKVKDVIDRYNQHTKSNYLKKVLGSEYSERAKIFFGLQTIFDRVIDSIGSPPDWDFEARYKPTNDIEQLLNIIFIEEAEKLWGVLCFYNSVLKNSTKELLELFWVSGNRETRLKRWLQEKGINDYSGNNQDILNALLKRKNNDTAQNLLKKSRFNIPVAALFLAIPPPDSVYRCEVAFVTHLDEDDCSSVKRIWHFSDINFPEIVDRKVGYENIFTGLVNKQKVLVGLITEPILRGYLKDDMKSHIKERAKKDAEIALMKKHGEMLNLLTEPLESLTEALNSTQEDSQRLRAILYNPTKSLFAAAALVKDFFTTGHGLRLGQVYWKVLHQPGDYENPFAACAVLAAIVCTIFGKGESFREASDGNVLWCKTEKLLNQSDPAFKQLTKVIKLLLWHHKGSNEKGENKETVLRDYMKKVLIGNGIYKLSEDNINFSYIIESLTRFKEAIFTPFKDGEPKCPLLPLLLVIYDNDEGGIGNGTTVSPKITVTKTYDCFQGILIKRNTHLPPFSGIGSGLPVPRYAMLLSFFGGVIDYAVTKKISLDSANIEVQHGSKCCITLTFSANVFNDMAEIFDQMKVALGAKAGRLLQKGDFIKPFVDFCSLCSGELKEANGDEFKIQYSGSRVVYVSSIYAKDKTFKFSVAKEKSTERTNDND